MHKISIPTLFCVLCLFNANAIAVNGENTWSTPPKKPAESPTVPSTPQPQNQAMPGWAGINPATGKADQIYVPFSTQQPEPGNVTPSAPPDIKFGGNSVEIQK